MPTEGRTLGQILKAAREAKAITSIRKAARYAKVDEGTWRRYENDKPGTTISPRIMQLIFDAFPDEIDRPEALQAAGLAPDDAFQGRAGRPPASDGEILGMVDRLSPPRRELAERLLADLVRAEEAEQASAQEEDEDDVVLYTRTVTVEDEPVTEPSAADRAGDAQSQGSSSRK